MLPAPSTLLAFDFGLRRIGVAVGNSLTQSAGPLTTIEASDDEGRFRAISRLVEEWSPTALVVGVPRHPDGQPNDMTERCERFARQLEGRYALVVHRVDERYSSVEAAREQRERSSGPPPEPGKGRRSDRASRGGLRPDIDALAAAIILRQHLGRPPEDD